LYYNIIATACYNTNPSTGPTSNKNCQGCYNYHQRQQTVIAISIHLLPPSKPKAEPPIRQPGFSFCNHGNPAVSSEIRGFPSLPHGRFGLIMACIYFSVLVESIISEQVSRVYLETV
jgi:hypothetical protein